MPRYCLTLGLRADPALIEGYIEHHRHVWPSVEESLREAGVLKMQIYHLGVSLFMILETTEDFTFERKAAMDRANSAVQEWEKLMSRYQDVDGASDPTSRWRVMDKVYELD